MTLIGKNPAFLALGISFLAFSAQPALAQADGASEQKGGVPTVTVTAQRTEESLQSVPIAVSAVDAGMLERQQIDNFSDLQFNVPNVTFSKTNFTGANFAIRGIGNTLIASTSDSGVSVHINDVAVNSPMLFETEYYDVERIEVLRGPQGTLFGRNATAGVVNMITKRAVIGEFEGKIEAEYGSFDHKRLEGALNFPISDKAALRLAGNFLKRDGYTENLYNGNDIDGRDSYSLRASVRLEPSDRTTIDLMVSWFEEDSNRARAQKQLCHRDPVGVLGCLPDRLGFDGMNPNAFLAGIVISDLALGPYALVQYPGNANNSEFVPSDLRKVYQDIDPEYRSDELLITLNIEQQIGDNFVFNFTGGYQDHSIWSQDDYGHDVGIPATIPQAVYDDFPIVANTFFPGGLFPLSEVDDTGVGVIGGKIRNYSDSLNSYDQSDQSSKQWTGEARLTSSFDGPLNFMIGAFYLDYDYKSNYFIASAALDYFALLGAPAMFGPIADGLALSTALFNNVADPYRLKSWAVFGEVYYDINEDVRLTGGIRYTKDKKTVTDTQYPLFEGGAVPIFSQEVFLGVPRTAERQWGEVTGRVVLEWSPDLDSFDQSMFFVSYSRGYKGGGLNPPVDQTIFPDSEGFDPEFLNAYEIGAKLNFADNRAQANITAFYYDYQGLQIAKLINRTSLNENIDAKLWGMEGEFIFAPNENWLFNLNASYLHSSIGETGSVDPRDPTNGASNVTLIKDLGNASNCVVQHNNSPDPTTIPQLAPLFGPGAFPVPGLNAKGAFSSCEALAANLAGFNQLAGTDYTVDGGNEVNLRGNQLQQAPDFTINIGAQYTHYFGNGMSLSLRADYYYQSNMFGRMFNKDIDRIDSWDQLNAQIKLESANGSWHATAYVKNIMNDDNITGMHVTDPASGLFTNVFILEPRRFGVTIGANF